MCDAKKKVQVWSHFVTDQDFEGCEYAEKVKEFVTTKPELSHLLFSTGAEALDSLKELCTALEDLRNFCDCRTEEEKDWGCILPKGAYEIDGAYLDQTRPPPYEGPSVNFFCTEFARVLTERDHSDFDLCALCSDKQIERWFKLESQVE